MKSQEYKPEVSRDCLLRTRLEELSLENPDFWSFRGRANRDHGHGLLQYPAMMVPQMVRELMRVVCETEQDIKSVGDPFVGSGTVLTETMLRGLDFVGFDVNPLAILACTVKAGPFFDRALFERSIALCDRASSDRSVQRAVEFCGADKWFTDETLQVLSRFRRAIRQERSIWARRFFWIVLAETVRLCSNSRTSTFKLHIRNKAELESRKINVECVFRRILKSNLEEFLSLRRTLGISGYLERGRYSGATSLTLGDTRSFGCRSVPVETCDLIITSPPYGDNKTTVPYGQYSFLPLQWIDLADIDSAADAACLDTTHEIDRRSLGGSLEISGETVNALCARSKHLAETLDQLSHMPRDRSRRVVAFVRDIDACIPTVMNMLRPNGVMVWVLGNRRVGGLPVPLDAILSDLLYKRGATLIKDLRRRIPSKRMAVRNNVAETFSNETILVFRKGATNAFTG